MKYSVLNLLIIAFELACPMQVIMERANVIELNHKYIHWGKVSVSRFGRRSPHFFNIEGSTKHEWNNNVSIHLLFYEYLHNEYRPSFVEMHFKLCDGINSYPCVGKMLSRSGIVCPLPAKEHHLMNMTLDTSEFPNLWPFQKGKIVLKVALTDGQANMGSAAIYSTFLQKNRNT